MICGLASAVPTSSRGFIVANADAKKPTAPMHSVSLVTPSLRTQAGMEGRGGDCIHKIEGSTRRLKLVLFARYRA
jgi:hypothetical protein